MWIQSLGIGTLDHLFVNCAHPTYCHVKCDMIPSLKSGLYHVYVLLVKTGTWLVELRKQFVIV